MFVFMIFIKYKMYNLKNEIRIIENKIIRLSYNKNSLLTEFAYLSNPERLNKIYSSLVNKHIVTEKSIASHNNIKNLKSVEKYYAEKYRDDNKKTNIVSNEKIR